MGISIDKLMLTEKKKIRCDDAWGETLTVEYLLIKRIKHFQSNFVRYKR